MGEVIDSPNISSGNSTETEKEDNVWTQRLAQALTSSKLGKRAGSSLGSFERAIQELLYPRVPWREVLWSLVQEVTKEDYSFLRPNRRYSSTPFCIPSLYSERIGSIIVAVDTSGSISQKDIDQFAAEIEEIMVCMNTTLHVVYCDTKVRGSQTFEPGDPVTLKPAGGGGTRYSPVFEWVEKEEMEPACLIYLTDGYCSDFPKETTVGYSTIWVTNRDGWEAPFGSMVRF
jgi:predicted metal-dependent peptidase